MYAPPESGSFPLQDLHLWEDSRKGLHRELKPEHSICQEWPAPSRINTFVLFYVAGLYCAPHCIAKTFWLRKMSEADFHIQTFGRLLMTSADGRLALPRPRKARALLAVLALSADGSCSRTKLASMLWEDASEAAGRNCLRQTLHQLATTFERFEPSPLTITREIVILDRQRCRIDLFAFRQQSCETSFRSEEMFQIDPETLLEDLQFVSPSFHEWLLCQRAKLRATLESEIERELELTLKVETFAPQRYAIARQISIQHPASEKASRAVISSLIEMGETALALKEYERCRDVLRRDFDAKPSIQTRALYEELRSNSSFKQGPAAAPAKSPPASASGRPSVAILPFANLTGNSDRDYLVDGIVEDVTIGVAKSPWLLVIASNSSFTFARKDVDLLQVGSALGACYVVQGSFRELGDQIRVSASLVDAASNVQLWADYFTARRLDIFVLQDELVGRIVSSLVSAIQSSEMRRALNAPTDSLTAYDYFLRGMAAWRGFSQPGFESALGLFKKSIEADPSFAAPYGLAASCHLMSKAIYTRKHSPIFREEVQLLIDQVRDKGAEDALALAWAAHAAALVCGDLDDAIELVERALSLNPNLAVAWQRSGWLNSYAGNPSKAIDHLEHALRLNPVDPLNFLAQTAVGFAHFVAGEHEQAVRWARKALLARPKWVPALRVLAPSLACQGKITEAKRAGQKQKELSPEIRIAALTSHYPFSKGEAFERLAAGFRIAGLPT